MNRKARLFALAEALRARRTGVTAEALAERFGVTVRTMYRALATLQDAGLPLRADRGRGGGSALDKVRGALSTSAQRELLTLLDRLQFVGVPALPVTPEVRRAVETAWFEERALRIEYQKNAYTFTPRLVRIRNLVFDRALTLLNCVDLELGEDRQFRLDKIVRATVIEEDALPSA